MAIDRIVTDTGEDYIALLQDIYEAQLITLDVETTGLNPYKGDRVCGLAIRFPYTSRNRYYVPVRHEPHYIDGYDEKGKPIIVADPNPGEYNLPMEDYIRILDELKVTKIQRGYNYKFDLSMLRMDGMELPMNIEDPMIMAYLCNENERNFKLKDLSVKYLGKNANVEQKGLEELLNKMGYGKGEMWKLYPEQVAPYAMDDVLLTDQMYEFYTQHINVWNLNTIMEEYFDFELVVHIMEYKGMRVDPQKLKRYKREAWFNAKHIEHTIREQVGYDINLNSSKQTCAWLGIHSSAMDVLESVIESTDDEVKKSNIRLLLEYKSWMKVYGTYYNKFEELMDEDNVIHPSFQVIGTVSGRLSCRTPNLQALPRKNKVKGGVTMGHIYKVKDVFVAREGNYLLSSDMSQAELRLGAVRANVSALKDKIKRGVDVHSETAFEMGVPRYQAKTLNFSIFYGMGASALSDKIGVSLDEAKSILRKYHELHPEIRSYSRELEARARAHGYIRMFTGRVKRYPKDQHKAISGDIQGGVAELMRIAMVKLHRLGLSQYLSNQIHDDIILEIPIVEMDRVAEIVGRVLTEFEFVMGDVPMETDTKIGYNWGDMISYEDIRAGNKTLQ